MSVYVDEDFNELPNGPGVPAGWSTSFASCVVFPAGPGSQYPGDKFYQCNGGSIKTPNIIGQPNTLTIWAGFQVNEGAAKFTGISINMFDNASSEISVCQLVSENDNTISVRDGSVVIKNTHSNPNPTYFDYQQGVWYYIQFNIKVGQNLSTGFVTVTFNVYFNGENILSGGGDTGSFIASFPTIGISSVQFNNALTGYSSYSRIVIEDQVGGGVYPVIAVPNTKSVQFVAEPSLIPAEEDIIVNQLATELSELPTNENIIVPQMVIELATIPGAVTSGWIVQEA